MDSRVALKEKTKLKFVNNDGGEQYFLVLRELGRGATCIVYEAYCKSNTGGKIFYWIKECYPHNLHIKRLDDGNLVVDDNEAKQFIQELDNFESSFF